MPRVLQIGPVKWSVRQDVERVVGVKKTEKDAFLSGHCDRDGATITVDPTCTAEVQRETLFHEVLHACFPAGIVSSDDEESIVGALSQFLLDTLLRNPRLVTYLTEGES